AAADEFIANVDGVSDATCEHDSSSAFAKLVPVGDDVADKFGTVHAISELRLDIVAPFDAHAAQIWIDGRVNARFDEVALPDQLGDLGALDHHVEEVAQAEAIASAWRCRQAKQDCLGISVNDPPIGGGASMVCLIYD